MESTKEALEEWNPLDEAYNNPDFNSYTSGPGADLDHKLQIPSNKKEELRTYKLFIKNIPPGLTQIGLKNIFSHFGNVTHVFIGRASSFKYKWAMVDYDTQLSAQEAIKALSLKPPYNLEVQFALTEREKERLAAQKKLLEEESQSDLHTFQEVEQNEEKPKMLSVGILPQTILLSSDHNGDDIAFDYTYFNHYSGEYLSDATHRLFSHLSTLKEESDYLLTDISGSSLVISAPVSLLNCQSKKLDLETDKFVMAKAAYDRKNGAIYEFGDVFNCGKCQFCGSATISSCKNCGASYCETKCLLKHWPEHKTNCIPSMILSNGINDPKNAVKFNGSVSPTDMQKLSDLVISEETSKKRFERPESITAFLKEGFTGLLKIREKLTASKFVATLVCSELIASQEIFTKVPEIVTQIQFDELYKPEIGEVVGLETNEMEWSRGFVYANGQVILCDTGSIEKCTRTKKLPCEICTMPKLAVYCSLLEYNQSKNDFVNVFMQGDNDVEFSITRCNKNSTVEACFKSDSSDALVGKLLLSPLAYFSHVYIPSGSNIILSAFYNCATIYVQSFEPEAVETYMQLMQDLGAYCQTEKFLDSEPALGDLVAVRYSKDGNWYRGQLLKKQNHEFQVIFVDFGNIEIIPLTEMKPLTSCLKFLPCCAVRVGLADILHDTPLTNLALQFLTKLCGSSETLRIEYSNNDLTSVKLLRQDNIDLCDELKILNKPAWKKALDHDLDPTEGEAFMFHDVMNCILTEGKEYQLQVLLFSLPGEIILCNTRSDLSRHVMGVLSSQLNEYCSALTYTSYNPRESELCIVQLEDDGCWYRAVCLQTLFSTTQARVAFIDFGNTCVVSHKNIRQFCKDFISTPAMAIMCNYEGISENSCGKVKTRLEELIQPNNEYKVLVKSFDKDIFYYNIDIPDVTSVLKKEQLL